MIWLKQPNGKYAGFSAVTDQIVVYDMTETEFLQEFIEDSVRRVGFNGVAARFKMTLSQVDTTGSSARPPFSLTWKEAKKIHYKNRGAIIHEDASAPKTEGDRNHV